MKHIFEFAAKLASYTHTHTHTHTHTTHTHTHTRYFLAGVGAWARPRSRRMKPVLEFAAKRILVRAIFASISPSLDCTPNAT
jgi:hypothetical protein